MSTVTVLIWNCIWNIAASCLMILEGYRKFVLLTFYKSEHKLGVQAYHKLSQQLKISRFSVLPVTSRFPGPAWDVSTKNVTGFPTIPFLHSLTCMASTLYTLQGNGEPGTGSFPNETKIWCSPATFGQNSALKVPLEISWTCAGTDSPDGESMAISMSSTEPITFDNVKYDIFPTAVAANDCPDTMIWLGSIRKKKVQNDRKKFKALRCI